MFSYLFYIWDYLNRESFLANYSKEGNLQNFSSVDDSRYMVYVNGVASHASYKMHKVAITFYDASVAILYTWFIWRQL